MFESLITERKLVFASLLLISCIFLEGCINSEDELKSGLLSSNLPGESAQVSPGTADFSKYVAVGNSLTAGFMDAALYNGGQAYSYANLLSKEMRLAGGGSFNQPDINSVNGYNVSVSDPENGIILGRFVLNTSIPGPEPLADGDLSSILTPYNGSVNNFGVPAARVVDMVAAAYGTPDLNGDMIPEGNPFYVRFASDPGNSTVLGDAAAANGSFVSIWIGQNDLLGYLTSGGTSADVEDNPAAIQSPSSLTDVANFTGALSAVVGAMTAGGQKGGVIANLLDATFTPFFRAVPFNAIPLDAATAAFLMAGPNGDDGFNDYNDGLEQLAFLGLITQADADARKVNLVAGANPILIEDDQLEDISQYDPSLEGRGQMRPMKSNELVLLTAKALINTVPQGMNDGVKYGVTWPLPDRYTLTKDELDLHESRLIVFNATIASVATTYNLALVDMYSVFEGIASSVFTGGYPVQGQMLQSDFSPKGLFSTDGIHPNARGQAIIANAFIGAINAKYDSELKEIDILNLPGVSFKEGHDKFLLLD